MTQILAQLRAMGWSATADLLGSVPAAQAAEFARTLARVGPPSTHREMRQLLRRFAVLADGAADAARSAA